MIAEDHRRCPVCRARFSGSATCSRCGADLGRLMLLVAEASRLRAQARRLLASAELEQAWACARRAQSLAATRAGARLEALLAWLD